QNALDKEGKPIAESKNLVSISLDYLPDFAEEYSIHIRAGFGVNHTKVTLDKGWNLTSLDAEVDSKTAENINAIAALLGSVAKVIPSGATAPAMGSPRVLVSEVPAYNVPLGYYEAVVNVDSCGEKRLYGWRYVGFMPFSTCPTNVSGLQSESCKDGNIFGLVSENGVMVFKRLGDLESTPVKHAQLQNDGTSRGNADALAAVKDLIGRWVTEAKTALGDPGITEAQITYSVSGNMISFTIQATKMIADLSKAEADSRTAFAKVAGMDAR